MVSALGQISELSLQAIPNFPLPYLMFVLSLSLPCLMVVLMNLEDFIFPDLKLSLYNWKSLVHLLFPQANYLHHSIHYHYIK